MISSKSFEQILLTAAFITASGRLPDIDWDFVEGLMLSGLWNSMKSYNAEGSNGSLEKVDWMRAEIVLEQERARS